MTLSNLTIALDIMGGDNGPLITLPAAISAVRQHPNLTLILCGDKFVAQPILKKFRAESHPRLILHHCSQTVASSEKPTVALRTKKDSSMRKAIDLVEEKKADACVSAGNTGALLATAYYVLKTLPGIDRPALISALPAQNRNKVYLLDLGANIDCSPDVLLQYAVMGSVLAEEVEKRERPKVALLNVGEEQIKGNENIKQAAALLSASPSINYIGFVEGNDIFTNKADVVVTDGFVGNVALKASEGLGKLILSEVKRIASRNMLMKILARLALPLLKKIYARVNPDQYNGASLIGLRGIVVKSHGNASAEAFSYAIQEAMEEVSRQVPTKIKHKLETVLVEQKD